MLVTLRRADALIAGTAARHRSLCDWYEGDGATVVPVALRSADAPQGGRLRRLWQVVAGLVAVLARSRRMESVHVEGLATPAAIAVAAVLRVSGRPVRFDACDSWALLAEMQDEDGKRRLMLAAGRRQRRLLRGCEISYVTSRDAEVDARHGFHRTSIVIPNSVAAQVRDVPRFLSGTPRGFVVTGLYSSPHLAPGLAMLSDAWDLCARDPDVPDLYVFGTPREAFPLRDRMHWRGYVPTQAEIYAAQHAAIVLNHDASGVPNKLLEAVAAQRPVVMHRALAGLLYPHPMLWTFHDASSLAAALAACSQTAWDFTEEYRWVT